MASLHPFRSRWRVHYRVLGLQCAEGPFRKSDAQARKAEIEYQLSRGIDPRTGQRFQKGRGITFDEGLKEFGEWSAKRQRAKLTLKRDVDELDKLSEHAPPFLNELRNEHIEAFLDSRSRLQASSYNKAVFAVKAFCKAMHDLGHLNSDLGRSIKARKIPRRVPDIMTLEEVAQLLTGFDDFDRPFALFVATTGCRRGEACQLRWDDVELPKVVIRSPKEKHDKTLVLPEGLCGIIQKLPRATQWVFPNRRGNMRGDNLSKLVKNAAKRAGLDPSRVHWHALRHTVATYLITQEPPR